MFDNKFYSEGLLKKFVFYYFKILGIAPINYEKTFRKIFYVSKVGTMYNSFIICLLIMTGYVGMKFMINTNYQEEFKEEIMIAVLLDISRILNTILTLIIYCARQKEIVSILNKICLAIKSSSNLDGNNYKLINSSIKIRCTICFINVILIFISFYLMLKQKIYLMCYSTFTSLDLFIVNAIYLQYSFIVENMKELFKSINDFLDEISKNYYRFFKIEQLSIYAKLDQTMQLYSLLSEITEDVSSFYSFIFLWSTLNGFVALFTNLYFVLKRIIILKASLDEVIWDFYNLYFEALTLPLLAISVSNTVAEVILILFVNFTID